MQSNAISAILKLMCHGRTVGVTSTSSHWMNVGSRSRAQLLTGELNALLRAELPQWKLSYRAADLHANIRPLRRRWWSGSAHFNLLEGELSKLVGVDVS